MLAETFRPSNPDRRMLVVLLAVQLLLPALSAPFVGVELTPLWTMQAWFLLPIILLGPPTTVVPRMKAAYIAAAVLGVTALGDSRLGGKCDEQAKRLVGHTVLP